MCDSLATICDKKRTNWDQQLSKLVFSYNTSRHASTKLTPFELMFGRVAKLPFDLRKKTKTIIEPHQYVKNLKEYLEVEKHMTIENILNSQDKSKRCYNANHTNETYSIGDYVYVKQSGLNSKLTPKYVGRYQVIQQLNASVFRIQIQINYMKSSTSMLIDYVVIIRIVNMVQIPIKKVLLNMFSPLSLCYFFLFFFVSEIT